MSLFLLTFLLIYGGFHLYFLLKIKAAFFPPGWVLIILALFLLFMVAAPILVRISERNGQNQLAIFLAYFGYTWMGFIFIFAAAAFTIDCCRIVFSIANLFMQNKQVLHINAKTAFYIPLIFSLFVSVAGAFEAWDVRLEKITLRSAKIPPSLKSLRVVQISDVHLGLIVRHKRLEKILAKVKEAEPDILVSTGDLVDGELNELEGLAAKFQKIRPRLGKYAVTGNHEFYAGLNKSLAFTESAGFKVLRNKGENITDFLTVAGADDRTGKYFDKSPEISEKNMLKTLDRDKFILLLKHRPEVAPESPGLFDLQLSGHTHKGQIFPFNIITLFYFPIHWGCLNPVDHCFLYVSRGSGTWGPPIRFLSPPEVTLIEIKPSKK